MTSVAPHRCSLSGNGRTSPVRFGLAALLLILIVTAGAPAQSVTTPPVDAPVHTQAAPVLGS